MQAYIYVSFLLFYVQKYGLKWYLRDPSSYTPMLTPGGPDGKARSLTIHRDQQKTAQQIAQFSTKDAVVCSMYTMKPQLSGPHLSRLFSYPNTCWRTNYKYIHIESDSLIQIFSNLDNQLRNGGIRISEGPL